jgi:hypothetical protein
MILTAHARDDKTHSGLPKTNVRTTNFMVDLQLGLPIHAMLKTIVMDHVGDHGVKGADATLIARVIPLR